MEYILNLGQEGGQSLLYLDKNIDQEVEIELSKSGLLPPRNFTEVELTTVEVDNG